MVRGVGGRGEVAVAVLLRLSGSLSGSHQVASGHPVFISRGTCGQGCFYAGFSPRLDVTAGLTTYLVVEAPGASAVSLSLTARAGAGGGASGGLSAAGGGGLAGGAGPGATGGGGKAGSGCGCSHGADLGSLALALAAFRRARWGQRGGHPRATACGGTGTGLPDRATAPGPSRCAFDPGHLATR